ncbi:MAG TPA: hypothetical protein PKE21_11655 [Flavobacteriales bacterium]|nr:hypothetical protein [Flavobacteriales bacterium]HMR28126.1 hypothetical protein [Flavobacteriales bacterium]
MNDTGGVRVVTWAVLLAYGVLLFLSLAHHELWGDEIHSWNIARSSQGLTDLLRNSRYEGHPPLWYVVLYTITRITHDPAAMKVAQALFAMAMVCLVLFASPFPLAIRALIPFGYYFTFEYGALSRNYAVAVALALLTTWVVTRRPRHLQLWFHALVLLLSNTHLLGLLLALSFCAVHAWRERLRHRSTPRALLQLAIGALICLPAALRIAPPGDSELNLQFWMDHWTEHQWDIMAQAPLKAFIPIPDGGQFHFWNTNALLERLPKDGTGRMIVRWCAVALLAMLGVLLRKVPAAAAFFTCNALLTAAVAFIFPLTSARYVGFLFVAFLIAAWLHQHERPIPRGAGIVLVLVLAVQVAASVIPIRRDLAEPFSNSSKVRELFAQVPPDALTVTDYWCLNNLSAFLDRPFYCLEHRKELTYLRWDQELARAIQQPNFYSSGLRDLWDRRSLQEVYMISVNEPGRLLSVDGELSAAFEVTLVDRWEGAIEPRSNVYLYRITRRPEGL